jgi:transcriptional regulator with XRE-family HTH domain
MKSETLGARIRSLREARKCSLRAFARNVEMSPSFLCEIEAGRSYPSDDLLERIASELGVNAAGLRKLDRRSEIGGLKILIESDPAWGAAFSLIVQGAHEGRLTPSGLFRKLGGKAGA